MNPFLEAALEYYDHGWSVIQLEVKGKKPLRAWAEFQKQRAPKELLEAWWKEFPHANVGIVCGAVSGIAVVDVDPRNGGDSDKIAEIVSTQNIVETGSGGRHFYTYLPNGLRVPCRPNIKPGVDIKSDGGYVVAPPSIHPCGKPYLWLQKGQSCVVPTWCCVKPSDPPAAAPPMDTEPWIAQALEHPELVECGNQENTLTRLCWYLSRDLPQDIVQAILLTWADGLVNYDKSNPWADDHITERVGRAFDKRARENRLVIEDDPGSRVPQDKPGRLAMVRSRLKTARAHSERSRDEVEWIVEGFAGPACLTEFIGPVKMGKSTLVYTMVSSVVKGRRFLGRPTRQSNVMILTEQSGRSLDATLNRAGILNSDQVHILTSADLMGVPWHEVVEFAVTLAQENDCRTIVVDTLAKMARLAGDDENSSGAMMEALHPFHLAQRHGIAVVFVRHGRKSGGAVWEAGRGSTATSGEMDICVKMEGKQGMFRELEIVSRLSDIEGNVKIKYQDGLYVLQTDNDLKLTPDDKRLIEVLPEKWSSTAEIAKVYGKSPKVTLAAIEKLMEMEYQGYLHGQIVKEKRGNRGWYFMKAIKTLEIEDA